MSLPRLNVESLDIQSRSRGLIYASYNTTAAQSIADGGSFKVVDFGTLVVDEFSLVTTGASWVFTCPFEGMYLVLPNLRFASAGGWAVGESTQSAIRKNGTVIKRFTDTQQVAHTQPPAPIVISGIIQAVKGDTIDIVTFQNSGSALALTALSDENSVEISYLGKL